MPDSHRRAFTMSVLKGTLKAALSALEDPVKLRRVLQVAVDRADEAARVAKKLQLASVLGDLLDEPHDPVVRERWQLTGQLLLVELSPIVMRMVWAAGQRK